MLFIPIYKLFLFVFSSFSPAHSVIDAFIEVCIAMNKQHLLFVYTELILDLDRVVYHIKFSNSANMIVVSRTHCVLNVLIINLFIYYSHLAIYLFKYMLWYVFFFICFVFTVCKQIQWCVCMSYSHLCMASNQQ